MSFLAATGLLCPRLFLRDLFGVWRDVDRQNKSVLY